MATKKTRDNFSSKTKSTLRDRAGHKCSNPDCEVYTTGPGNGSDEAMHLGDAAHICAASPNGPRYDERMSSDERTSIDNGIWLCTKCARKIDRNDDRHSVELLKEWKNKAEERARRENGEKSYSKLSVTNEVISIFSGNPSSNLNIIELSHAAINAGLQQMDPRFMVTSRFDGKRTEYTLDAKENVRIDLTINTENIDNFDEKYARLLNDGDSLSIPTEYVKVSGSKLIEHAINDQSKSGTGALIFSPPKRPGTLRIHTEDIDNNPSLELDEIQGYYQVGFQRFQFIGALFSELISLKLKAKFIEENNIARIDDVTVTYDTPFTPWENQNVLNLINFDELYDFCKNIKGSENIVFKFRFKSKNILSSKAKCSSIHSLIDNILTIHSYISLTRKFSEITGIRVNFEPCEIKAKDWQDLRDYIRYGSPNTLHGIDTIKYNEITLNLDKLITQEEKEELIGRTDENFSLIEREATIVKIFNQNIKLPRRSFNYSHVSISSIEDDGFTSSVKLIPNDNFYWNVTYIND